MMFHGIRYGNLVGATVLVGVLLSLETGLLYAQGIEKIRKESHSFLFDKFLSDKECVNDDNGELKEVVIYRQTADSNFKSGDPIQVATSTEKVCALFDYVVIRGSGVDQKLEAFILPYGEKIGKLESFDKSTNEQVFRLPPLPVAAYRNRELPPIQIKLAGDSEFEVSEISLQGYNAIERDFKKFFDRQNAIKPPEISDFRSKLFHEFLKSTKDQSLDQLSSSLGETSEKST